MILRSWCIAFLGLTLFCGASGYSQPLNSSLRKDEPEQLGELSLADFLVEPSFYYSEKGNINSTGDSGFSLGNTYFAANWKLQKFFSGRIQLGSFDLLNRPSWSPETQQGLGFVEAYAQYETALGRIRAGLIPIFYGVEGSTSETRLWFPRTMFYRDGFLGLRDIGANYSITHNGFFTDVTGHNGEGGLDHDSRTWMTGRWGWIGPAGVQIGASGAVGYYRTLTNPKDTKVRYGNLFFSMELYSIGLAAEGSVGEIKNPLTKYQVVDWYASIRHGLGKDWGLLARYEFLEPSSIIAGDAKRQASGGLYIKNETDTSRLTFLFIKNWEEVDEFANDEYRLTWKITSAFLE